jgi:hypothetical protein
MTFSVALPPRDGPLEDAGFVGIAEAPEQGGDAPRQRLRGEGTALRLHLTGELIKQGANVKHPSAISTNQTTIFDGFEGFSCHQTERLTASWSRSNLSRNALSLA